MSSYFKDMIYELMERNHLRKLKVQIPSDHNMLDITRIFDILSRNTCLQVLVFDTSLNYSTREVIRDMVRTMLKTNTTLVKLCIRHHFMENTYSIMIFDEELQANRTLLVRKNMSLMKKAADVYATLDELPEREIVPEEVYKAIIESQSELKSCIKIEKYFDLLIHM